MPLRCTNKAGTDRAAMSSSRTDTGNISRHIGCQMCSRTSLHAGTNPAAGNSKLTGRPLACVSDRNRSNLRLPRPNHLSDQPIPDTENPRAHSCRGTHGSAPVQEARRVDRALGFQHLSAHVWAMFPAGQTSGWPWAIPRIVMIEALERPGTYGNKSKVTRKLSNNCSRRVTPGAMGDLRNSPKVAEQLPQSCSESLIRPKPGPN